MRYLKGILCSIQLKKIIKSKIVGNSDFYHTSNIQSINKTKHQISPWIPQAKHPTFSADLHLYLHIAARKNSLYFKTSNS